MSDHSSGCRTLFFSCQAHLPLSSPSLVFSLEEGRKRSEPGPAGSSPRRSSCQGAKRGQGRGLGSALPATSGWLFFVNTLRLPGLCRANWSLQTFGTGGKAMHCKRPKALLQIQGSRCACKRDFLRLGSVAKPARCFDCLSLLICASLLTGPGAGGGIKATACLRTVTRIDTSSRRHVEIAPLLKLYLFLHISEVILAPPFPQVRSWGGTGTAPEQ